MKSLMSLIALMLLTACGGSHGGSASQGSDITVLDIPATKIVATEGDTVTLQLSSSDSKGRTLTYGCTCSNVPGVTIDATTGLFTYVVQVGQRGTTNFNFYVAYNGVPTVYQLVPVAINYQSTFAFTNMVNQTVHVGQTLTYTPAANGLVSTTMGSALTGASFDGTTLTLTPVTADIGTQALYFQGYNGTDFTDNYLIVTVEQ